jgi:hypothetical protein
MIWDYNAGSPKLIAEWKNEKEQDEALEVLLTEYNSGRDFVWIVMLVTYGMQNTGHFIVQDSSSRKGWVRAFSGTIYPYDLAFVDIIKRCRKQATKLGFRIKEDKDKIGGPL